MENIETLNKFRGLWRNRVKGVIKDQRKETIAGLIYPMLFKKKADPSAFLPILGTIEEGADAPGLIYLRLGLSDHDISDLFSHFPEYREDVLSSMKNAATFLEQREFKSNGEVVKFMRQTIMQSKAIPNVFSLMQKVGKNINV